MKWESSYLRPGVAAFFLLFGYGFTAYGIERESFWLLMTTYFILFLLSVYLARVVDQRWLLTFVLGMVIRGAMILASPNLSEDYARFLWDGELLVQSENPYSLTPRQWLEDNEGARSYQTSLFQSLNSKDYYSVYPPTNQAVFWLAALGAREHSMQGIIFLRLMLLGAECALFFVFLLLIRRFQVPLFTLGILWLNPFFLIESTLNLHFEVIVLLFLGLTLLLFSEQKWFLAGLVFALSVAFKLVPLILLPSIIFFLRRKTVFKFSSGLLLGLIIGFAPLVWKAAYLNFWKSIRLYSGVFEFNASIYYLLRTVGYWIQGYNTIDTLTKILSVVTFVSILGLSWVQKAKSVSELLNLWIVAYLIYFLLQPIVHPWYLIPGFGLSLLSRSRVFVLWALLAIFSYQAYQNPNFAENPIFLCLEYIPVFLLLYAEIKRNKLPWFTLKKIMP
ncbi:hypothetical protein [Algoriphagus namhaensis]